MERPKHGGHLVAQVPAQEGVQMMVHAVLMERASYLG